MLSLPPDPWKALGVERDADKVQIRTAYKKAVLRCHPDKVQDTHLKAQKQEEFQKIQQAWELLHDEEELQKYEDHVKLVELRKQATMMAMNRSSSSPPRQSPRHHEIRTAEPRRKPPATPLGRKAIYGLWPRYSRAHEDLSSLEHTVKRRAPNYEDSENARSGTGIYGKASHENHRLSTRHRNRAGNAPNRNSPSSDSDDTPTRQKSSGKKRLPSHSSAKNHRPSIAEPGTTGPGTTRPDSAEVALTFYTKPQGPQERAVLLRTSQQRDDMSPAKAGLRDEESRPVDLSLVINLAGHEVSGAPDTGSERNIMSLEAAQILGLEPDGSVPVSDFRLANGRVIHSSGRVSTECSFPGENSEPLPIHFDVIRGLIAGVVLGRQFLEMTETLTKHATRRLRTRPRPHTRPPLILHLDPPRRALRCYLNELLISANADTGAEMNLASAIFAARAGFALHQPPPERQSVMLADGSLAAISGFFRARFNPLEKPAPETLRPRSHVKTFYVLDGLTSDVLLGRNILFEIQAFTQQAKSFIAYSNVGLQSLGTDLQIIEWLRNKNPKPGERFSSMQKYFVMRE